LIRGKKKHTHHILKVLGGGLVFGNYKTLTHPKKIMGPRFPPGVRIPSLVENSLPKVLKFINMLLFH
jgi:hypothetical protein